MSKQIKKKLLSVLLALTCIVGTVPIVNVVADTVGEVVAQTETSEEATEEAVAEMVVIDTNAIPSRMKMVAENDALQLYFDETETDIAVRVKDSGTVLYSNPVNGSQDEQATAFYQKMMKSQLSVTYYNTNVQSSEMNNYSDSIEEGQFEVAYHEDGLTVTYTIGDMAEKMVLPQIISEERFLSFYDQMDSSVQKKVASNYTLLNLETMKEKDKKANLEAYPIINEHPI